MALPNAINSVYENPYPSGYTKAGDFGQLFYDELGASDNGQGYGTGNPQAVGLFSEIQNADYWSNTLIGTNPYEPFSFSMEQGNQYFIETDEPYFVMPDVVGTVPEPSTAWLIIIPGLFLLARRRKQLGF